MEFVMKKMILLLTILICCISQAWSQRIVSLNEDELINNLTLQTEEDQAFSHVKPITGVRVVKVISETYPTGEDIAIGQITTVYHHDGAYIYVYTFEQGEGQEPYAWIHSTDIQAKYLIKTLNICQLSNGELVICEKGGEFFGRLRVWDISSYGNGIFEYQIRTVSPGNKPFRTRLQIN